HSAASVPYLLSHFSQHRAWPQLHVPHLQPGPALTPRDRALRLRAADASGQIAVRRVSSCGQRAHDGAGQVMRPLRPATSPQVGRSFQSGQCSQALIEFALVSPVLLLLLFGVIDLGRAIFYYDTINHAAREGARVAVRASNSLPTNTDVLN